MKNQNLLEFPCSFPIKAFGHNADDFEAFVLDIARPHIPQFEQAAVSSRPSHGGKYLAVTITFTADSREQLDALYQAMSASKRVLMLF
jgi:putative lipoic acid-binding regulatory protein